MQDYTGWYVTFTAHDTARRAAMVLNGGARTLAQQSVNVAVVHRAVRHASEVRRHRSIVEELEGHRESLAERERVFFQNLVPVAQGEVGEESAEVGVLHANDETLAVLEELWVPSWTGGQRGEHTGHHMMRLVYRVVR